MTTHELEPTARRNAGLVSVDGRTYPLESAKLTSRAEGGLAFSRLTQVFANPYDEALEVVYTMPLPADGAVVGYTVRVGERTIRGSVEVREQANAAYQRALAEGRSAGLVEQDRDDAFQQRLGNIPPGVRAEVEIQVLHPLAFFGATDAAARAQWEFRFPTVVGVRYQGTPGRVKDAERLNVDRDAGGGIQTRLALELVVGDATAAAITSPTHAILSHGQVGSQHVEFAEGERLDRDVVIRWAACTNECGARLLTGGGLEGDEGRYGLVTLTPPDVRSPAFSRDLTVLLDASGSMHGQPLAWAKEVVRELLESLEPGDRFELLAFANRVQRLGGPMRFATPDAVGSALEALWKLEANGGTEMADAIGQALRPLRKDSQRQVVLVTDGEVGFEREVMATLMSKLPVNSRVHTVGVGTAPNRTVTAGVARAGRGVEVLIERAAGVGAAVRRLCAATAAPILTEVTVAGSAVRAVATAKLRDVFAGQPLLALVRLGESGGTLEVHGRLAGARELWTARLDVPAAGATAANVATTPLPVGALFGRERIADLELALAASKDGVSILAQIEAVAMKHRITSRRTSLVAIAEEPSVEPNGMPRSERLAVELPAGVSAEGSGLLGGMGEFGARFATLQAPEFFARRLDIEVGAQVLRHPAFAAAASPEPARELTQEERVRRQAASLANTEKPIDSAVRRLKWLMGNRRPIGHQLDGFQLALEEYLTTVAWLRTMLDELERLLGIPAPAPEGGAAAPAWASALVRLREDCEAMTALAGELVKVLWQRQANGARKEELAEIDRGVRDLIERHVAADVPARVKEVAGLVEARAGQP